MEISRTNITYMRNVMFPGFADEVELLICLKEGTETDPDYEYEVRVTAGCNNPEFNKQDEHVFTVKTSKR